MFSVQPWIPINLSEVKGERTTRFVLQAKWAFSKSRQMVSLHVEQYNPVPQLSVPSWRYENGGRWSRACSLQFSPVYFSVRHCEHDEGRTCCVTDIQYKLSNDVLVGQIFVSQIDMSYGRVSRREGKKDISIPIWPITAKAVGAPSLSSSGRKACKQSATSEECETLS